MVNVVVPDVANMKTSAEFPSCNEFLKTQLCKSSGQLPHLKVEESSKDIPSGNGNKNSPVTASRLEGVPLQRKSAKSNRSNGSCSKRPRMSLSEDSTGPNGIEEPRDISDKLGSHNLKCTSPGINYHFPQANHQWLSVYVLLTCFTLIFFWYREKSITKAKEQ